MSGTCGRGTKANKIAQNRSAARPDSKGVVRAINREMRTARHASGGTHVATIAATPQPDRVAHFPPQGSVYLPPARSTSPAVAIPPRPPVKVFVSPGREGRQGKKKKECKKKKKYRPGMMQACVSPAGAGETGEEVSVTHVRPEERFENVIYFRREMRNQRHPPCPVFRDRKHGREQL